MRLRVFSLTIIALVLELVLFAVQYGALNDQAPAFDWQIWLMRFAILLGACIMFYTLLEWADRVHLYLAVFVLVIGFIPLAILQQYFLGVAASSMGRDIGPPETLVLAADYWVQFLLAWGAAVLALFYYTRLTQEQQLRLSASAEAHRARMRALRYQMNPHFLFNTLNSIGLLALEKRGEQAGWLVKRLSAFLRETLLSVSTAYQPLRQEFAQISDYLSIEGVRFADRLSYSLTLPRELEEAAIPPFSLQPLIEYAIRHSVSVNREPTLISASASKDGDLLILRVEQTMQEILLATAPHKTDRAATMDRRQIPIGFSIDIQPTDHGCVLTLKGPMIYLRDTTPSMNGQATAGMVDLHDA